MAKLYPPYIEGTIPAFYTENVSGTAQTILTVPFSMNKSVGKANISGFSLKLKTVNSNVFLYTNLKATAVSDYDIENEYVVSFNLGSATKLRVGTFYKVQLAYIDTEGEIGYYSTVGIVKYTTKPKVTIADLSPTYTNMSKTIYYGNYSQENQDTTEKAYSYQFIITDSSDNVILDSKTLLHNCENNILTYESTDEHSFPDILEKNLVYYIQYIVTTVNKMVVASPKYRIVDKLTLPPEIKATLHVDLNYDNGYVEVNLIGVKNEDGGERAATGAYVITRSSADSDYTVWNELMRFQLHGQLPSRKVLVDYTIEQGKEYQYALQQYSDTGIYSNKILSNIIMADFEDAFLYDGERQLKIRYNPKIQSFKIDRPESKIETIGSKYPFFFRNGNVEYREFPISGLISYLGDEAELFMTNEELQLESIDDLARLGTIRDRDEVDLDALILKGAYIDYDYLEAMWNMKARAEEKINHSRVRTTDYLDYSIAAERMFKMKVLEWLTNGKPKLFRSPGEGNYVVRLMNVSLTPEDRTGRTIHSFTATAYEVAPFTYESLVEYDLIDTTEQNITQLRWETLPLATTENMDDDDRYTKIGSVYYAQGSLLTAHRTVQTVTFSDMQPGDVVYILTKSNFMANTTFNEELDRYILNNEDNTPGKIVIGATGSYTLDIDTDIAYIGVPANAQYTGLVTYSFYNDAQNVFNTIIDIGPIDYLGQQYIGAHPNNIVDEILNIKRLSCIFLYLHFSKREVGKAYYQNTHWYRNSNYTSEITTDPTPQIAQDTGYYADPLMLYSYEIDKFDTYLTDRNEIVTILGIVPVDNQEVQRSLIDKLDRQGNIIQYVYEGYYYLNNRNQLINAGNTTYLDSRQYYVKKPFKFYHDPYHQVYPEDLATRKLEHLIIDPESYKQALEYATDVLQLKKDGDLVDIDLYSNIAILNNYPLDLTEIEHYNIDFRSDFNNIRLNNGVVLECGFETQEVIYSFELDRKIQKSKAYKDYKQIQDLSSASGFLNFIQSRTNAKTTYPIIGSDYVSDMNYATKMKQARENYPQVYSTYLNLVTVEKKAWEEAQGE